ncbi:retrovirus-related pol polyprotein from transposon TNT 1-94, partial [Tanacetum coccineum]
ASDYDNPDPAPELQNVSPLADITVPSQQELDLPFGPLYDEFFNDGTSRVSKSSSPTDKIVQLILFIVDSGCTKHMTGNLSLLDLRGNDLLTGNRGTGLYTISLQETTSSNPICLMAKASPTQAWLWHRRLSHLNFDYINLISKKDVVNGLPKLKYVKDQLCFSCEVSKLILLHMDLCGPMRVASINGKKYILIIVDDYSRYTWTLFLRSKDETPEV